MLIAWFLSSLLYLINVFAGDAVLWPVGLDHTVWTEDESLDAIVIDGPAEREES